MATHHCPKWNFLPKEFDIKNQKERKKRWLHNITFGSAMMSNTMNEQQPLNDVDARLMRFSIIVVSVQRRPRPANGPL